MEVIRTALSPLSTFLKEAICLKPVNTDGHAGYQKSVVSLLKQYYPDAHCRFGPSIWKTIDSFFNLDLSMVDEFMSDRYSVFGPRPRLPSSMLRSMLLSLVFKKTGFTDWSAELKMNPLAAILSGFHPDDTPGVGTFYDFTDRLWLSEQDNFNPHSHAPKRKVSKPSNPNDKADSVEAFSVEELIENLKDTPPSTSQPFAGLFQIFNEIFLQHSSDLGLIDLSDLVLSGDGTEVVTSARHRYRRLCTCSDRKCSCNRYFSQPDTDCGYDSSRHKFYYGYNLYMFTAADSGSDLPVFPLLNPASMHDSFAFCHTFASMKAFLTEINVSEILLDSAHDAMAVYRLCLDNSINPIIDLNERNASGFKYRDNFTVGKDGVPVCRAGLKMCRDGCERNRMRIKYRCPNAFYADGVHCEHKCSDSPYGRVVHIATKDNPRIFTIPPRDSKEWKTKYNKRTSSERCNKREKEDYLLESGRHRSSKMWYCRLYCIMMCQHLDAWAAASTFSLKNLFEQAA